MTAEVAVLNRNAVALAADSAVTLRLPEGTKIYRTNKLFALSKYQPVAIMLYGSADFLDVPWETIIKTYRTRLGQRTFSTVADYGDDLLNFVEANSSFFPVSRQDYFCYRWTRAWLRRLKKRLKSVLEDKFGGGGTLSESQVKAVFRRVFDAEESHLARHEDLPNFRRSDASSLRRKYRNTIVRAVTDELQKLAQVVPRGRLVAAAIKAITADAYWHDESGIVVAGFGRQQFFPSLRSYTVDLVVDGHLRGREHKERRTDISAENSAAVTAFAQSEMVSLFMNGIDNEYAAFIRSFVSHSFLARYPELVLKLFEKYITKKSRHRAVKQLRAVGEKLVSALDNGIAGYTRQMHSDPIVEIVAHLPKEELAAMAEALVNLTSFKRHVTGQAETVGGPIDVAVISRGDGLIWIKRKHYFEPALNPHFLSNYYTDARGRNRQ
jgi:hypothetical protein